MANSAPFQDRRTWLIEVAEVADRKLKVYGICAHGLEIQSSTVTAAKRFVAADVRFPDQASHGFLILHHGEEAMWFLVDCWVEDVLHQQLFFSDLDDVENFRVAPPNHEIGCVWELPVIAHERDVWVKHIMTDPAKADYDAYLADVLTIA